MTRVAACVVLLVPAVGQDAVAEREAAVGVERRNLRGALFRQAKPQVDVAQQALPLRLIGAEGELRDLAEVVHERCGDQQVGVRDLRAAGRPPARAPRRHGVLQQSAEVGAVAPAGEGGGARRTERAVAEQSVQQRPVAGVADLAGEVLEEAVELVENAVGDRQEGSRGPPWTRRRGDRAQVERQLFAEVLDAAGDQDQVVAEEARGGDVGVAEDLWAPYSVLSYCGARW